jgi:hypothetical protein
MLLVIELIMLVGGIYVLFTAKVPSILVGGRDFQLEGANARLVGLMLILPLPLALLGGFLLAVFLGETGVVYASLLEALIVLTIGLIAILMVRSMGKRVEYTDSTEALIKKKSEGALMYAIFSFTGVGAIVCCPLALIYANQALKLIDQHGVGEEQRRNATVARAIAGVASVVWVGIVICACLTLFATSK